jgi:nitroreductase
MTRTPDHSIQPVFIERWSPRAFTDEVIDDSTLRSMFEAARWAPSANNAQPWRFVYGCRGTPAFQGILDGILPGNQVWAGKAAALVVAVGATAWVPPGQDSAKPLGTYAFDCGAAWMSVAMQAHAMGWATHGMAGIDRDALRTRLHVPEDFVVLMAFAVGRRGDKATLPEALQAREAPSPRRAVSESIGEGRFPGR